MTYTAARQAADVMARHMRAGNAPRHQRGLMYLWMLFLIFLLGLGLGKSLEVYSAMVAREKAADKKYAARQMEKAVDAFYEASPGSVKQYPEDAGDLLLDPRHLTTRRYLRSPLREVELQEIIEGLHQRNRSDPRSE